ncbi:MAG: glycosyltransferase [Clostridium sp.]|nr:glycosyltransferase [Bacteroides sp.]MCM1197289.1 glycosyltransferase [Clostridium sp.]
MTAISIIIPIYNVEQYLERCLKSIIDQTFTDWKAILVNDGSTDSSLAIAEKFASRDRRFIIINKENGGLSDARNAGMANADGEYVMFVDSDDFIHPQTCEIAIALARKTQSDIVSWKKYSHYTNITRLVRFLFNPSESTLVKMMPLHYRKRYDVERLRYTYTDRPMEYVTGSLSSHAFPRIKGAYVWRFLFRRELIKDIPFIKGLKYEDMPWWYEVVLCNPKTTITYLPLYYYFRNKTSITKSINRSDWFMHWCRGLEYIYLKYKESATEEQMALWSRNVKWHLLKKLARKLGKVGEDDREKVSYALRQIIQTGILDDAVQLQQEKTRQIITDFVMHD